MLNKLKRFVKSQVGARRLAKIYDKYKSFSMVPQQIYLANLAIAGSVKTISGAVVECGVWRGGMIAGIAEILGPERDYVLCDSFQGLPIAKEIDGPAATRWQQDTTGPSYHNNCSAEIESAKQAMKLSPASSIRYVVGWFDKTLSDPSLNMQIAVLRLDGDWYESTMSCLTALAGNVVPGGLILIDDYYTWDGCCRALHDYLSSYKLPWRISEVEGVCYIRVPRI